MSSVTLTPGCKWLTLLSRVLELTKSDHHSAGEMEQVLRRKSDLETKLKINIEMTELKHSGDELMHACYFFF